MSDDAAQTITVAGCPVRLYAPPRGGHEYAWISFYDLLTAAQFQPESIEEWAVLWRNTYPDRSSVAGDGEMIVSSECGAGLFEVARQHSWPPAERALEQLQSELHGMFIEQHRDLDDAAFRSALHMAMLRTMVTERAH